MGLYLALRGKAAADYSLQMPREPGEQPTNIVNVARFVANRREALPVLVNKVLHRLAGFRERDGHDQVKAWIRERSQDPSVVAQRLAPDLWTEAREFGAALRARAEPLLSEVPFDMGAGGDYEFLYWLARYSKPHVIVETGVSAGWTSQALLSAVERNGRGHLWSSDFPYFRVRDPERYIGLLVEPHLKAHWTLRTDGDEQALPDILSAAGPVDLFHYDSDKTFAGRRSATRQVQGRLSGTGLLIMDDIANDSFFMQYAEQAQRLVSVLGGRYGVIGDIESARSPRQDAR